MNIFRIVKARYAHSLAVPGRPARWNLKDEFVLYASASRSLATLELLVNQVGTQHSYKVMVLEVDETKVLKLAQDHLPQDWRTLRAYPLLQNMGSRWYHDQASLALEVPSAVIPQESNYILNTRHPDFQENVRIAETENYFWDKRL